MKQDISDLPCNQVTVILIRPEDIICCENGLFIKGILFRKHFQINSANSLCRSLSQFNLALRSIQSIYQLIVGKNTLRDLLSCIRCTSSAFHCSESVLHSLCFIVYLTLPVYFLLQLVISFRFANNLKHLVTTKPASQLPSILFYCSNCGWRGEQVCLFQRFLLSGCFRSASLILKD